MLRLPPALKRLTPDRTGVDGITAARAVAYLALAALLVRIHLDMLAFAADDAYIHFRIARNWIEWGAPYYNPGSPVLASSSPAWTVVLAGLFLLTGVDVAAVAVLNGLVLAAVVFVASGALRAASGRARWFCDLVALLVVVPFVLDASLLLMEVPLALLAAAGGAWLHLRDSRASLAVFALGAAVRPELGLLFLLALVDVAWHRRAKETLRRAGAALLAVSPILLFLLVFFESPIPQTIHAKGLVYDLSSSRALERLAGDIPTPPSWRVAAARPLWALAPLALGALAHRSGSVDRKTVRVAALLGLTGLGVAGAYVAAGVMTFPWYAPLFLVPVGLAVALPLVCVPRRWTPAVALLALLYPASATVDTTLRAAVVDSARLRQAPFRNALRTRQYLAVGEELYREVPDAKLLASEIGGLGFTFRGPIHDAIGLVSPEALKHHPMAVPAERRSSLLGAVPVDFVREVDPDVIVSLDVFVEDFLRSDLRSRYEMTRRPVVPPDLADPMLLAIYGARHLLVFRKKAGIAGDDVDGPGRPAPASGDVASPSGPAGGKGSKPLPSQR